jgi:hypothetical protein
MHGSGVSSVDEIAWSVPTDKLPLALQDKSVGYHCQSGKKPAPRSKPAISSTSKAVNRAMDHKLCPITCHEEDWGA